MSRGPLEPARLAIHRSLLRRHIRAVVAGKADRLNIDLADPDVDPAMMLIEVAALLDRSGPLYWRLLAAVTHPSLANRVIDGLGSRHPVVRARCARIAGAFQMEKAVPFITPLLWSKDSVVRDAAARALGAMGGVRSADSLLVAIQRLGPRPALIVALARAAPDLYLETILSRGQPRAAQPAVALATGLRRRRSAVAPLVTQISEGSSRLRAAGSRALGSIGATAGIPVLLDCLENRDWRVRLSAAKALGKIKDFQPSSQMLACLVDRNPRVRSAATCALHKHGRRSNSFLVRG
jgi:hypothetical protein